MNKTLLTSLLGVAMLLAAGRASADWRLNGIQLNGLQTAGQAGDDFRLNGTQVNGLPTPGPILQGTQVNGLPTPGPILQGTQLEGLTPGPVVQAIQAYAAPDWSALPAAQLDVRLPPAV